MLNHSPPATISAADFKAHCLSLMDEVKAKRQTVIITKYGAPVAKLVPVDVEAPSLFGWLKGTVTEVGDVISPIEAAWDAELEMDQEAGRE